MMQPAQSHSPIPSWRNPDHPTAHDRFRQIFREHWHAWCNLRLEEIPADQQAYARKTVERMILCRDPSAGYARYVCPGCGFDRRVPFSCKTRFCPSCGKVKVDHWVADIARDLFDVPHLHVTLTVDDLLWPHFHAHRSLLKLLLKTAAQAVRKFPRCPREHMPRSQTPVVSYTLALSCLGLLPSTACKASAFSRLCEFIH
jgi:hypothetical protein